MICLPGLQQTVPHLKCACILITIHAASSRSGASGQKGQSHKRRQEPSEGGPQLTCRAWRHARASPWHRRPAARPAPAAAPAPSPAPSACPAPPPRSQVRPPPPRRLVKVAKCRMPYRHRCQHTPCAGFCGTEGTCCGGAEGVVVRAQLRGRTSGELGKGCRAPAGPGAPAHTAWPPR